MNILLALGTLVSAFGAVLISYRFFGKTGVFVWIGVATVLANIQAVKTVEILGLTATLGNVLYGSIFLATDVLSEYYGDKEAKKSVYLGLLVAAFSALFMKLSLWFTPAASDISGDAFRLIFNPATRIIAASFVAYACSQLLDIFLFRKIKDAKPGDKYLWLRNNGATFIAQLFDTLIFVSVAFIGVYETPALLEIYATTYIFKIIVALLDTPFIYLSKKIRPKVENRGEKI